MGRKFSEVAPAPAPREWQGKYLDGDDKLAAIGTVFDIRHVSKNPVARFGPRWEVGVIDLRSQSEWTITLTCNPGRDAMMAAVAQALSEGEMIDPVVFEIVGENKKGNPPFGFRDATADEIAVALTQSLDLSGQDPAADLDLPF